MKYEKPERKLVWRKIFTSYMEVLVKTVEAWEDWGSTDAFIIHGLPVGGVRESSS